MLWPSVYEVFTITTAAIITFSSRAKAAPKPDQSWEPTGPSLPTSLPTESRKWPWTPGTLSTIGASSSPSAFASSAVSESSITAAPSSTSTATPTGPLNNEPCAIVSSLVANSTDAVPHIPAQIGWECLQSVPLNATAAVPWIESLLPYIGWQTTIAYLKDPPAGYQQPAIDVIGDLNSIIANVASYENEYALEFAIYEVTQRTYDGHFRYLPTLVGGVLTFGRPVALASVSSDGVEVPKPYVYSDILLAANDSTFEPSAVTIIDGVDAVTYLEDLSQFGNLQDPDALYNILFYNLAQISLGSTGIAGGLFTGGGRGAFVYPNATTTLTFENGSSTTVENFARVLQPFTGISSGQDIYNQYLAPPPKTTTSTTSASTPPPTPASASRSSPKPTSAPGYPSPVIRQINNLVAGYYIDTPGYEEVAVLSVPSFVGLETAEQSFQEVAFDFIAQSKADGKTKLIIDVSANGGGTILQGYNLFTNLFPDLIPYGATRFRAHEAFDIIGQTVSDVAGPVYPWNLTDPPGPDDVLNDFLGIPFDYRADVDINGAPFTSWPEKYGPHEFYGDTFTSIIRWNLSDPTTILTSHLIVNGYQNRTGIVPNRPYAAQDIVILYDGYCASTCTIFSEFMTQQAGIKTIAIGGRPLAGEPMQAIGGVKGANDWDWQTVYILANDTFTLGTPEQQAAWATTELGTYSLLPFERAADNDGYLNVRDAIRQGDTTETPLQFVYQAADCRIWYTMEMLVDVTTIWTRVADVTWGGQACVEGNVGLSSSEKVKKRVDEKSKEKTKNNKRSMKIEKTAEELVAFQDSLNLWTDLRGQKVVGDGYMLP